MPIIKYILTFLVLCGSLTGFAAKVDLRVSARGGENSIEVGQEFHIYYTVTNTDAQPQTPKSVPGAKVNYFTLSSQSSSFHSVNGHTTQSVTATYVVTLRAVKEGTYKFGPVSVGGVKSNVITYTIVPAGSGGHRGNVPGNSGSGSQRAGNTDNNGKPTFIGKGNDKLFMRASLSKSSAYEQEALVYTVKLYTTYSSIRFIGATAAPKFDGFVVEESNDISSSLSYETYQGRQYATAVIARYIIFPQQDGNLKIKGNTYTVSTDEMEYYDDPFFSTMAVRRPIQLNVTPNDLQVNVRPLPQPAPAGFSGGVGTFSISSSLPSSNFKSNFASTIIYRITGTGNIKYIHLPDLNSIYPPELEVYSPKTDVSARASSTNVSGTSTFDYTFMPLEEGDFRIPPVTLVYFNPQTGKYEKSEARGYEISVSKGKASAKSQTRNRLKYDSGLSEVSVLSFDHSPYVMSPFFWLFYILPVIALGTVMVIYRKYINMHADVSGMKSRKAGKVASRRLANAAKCLQSGDSSRFYDEMLSALWGYVSDKLRIPTSDLNRQNVGARLQESGVDQSEVDTFLSLVDDCEMAKYSPASSETELKQIYSKGADLIGNLENIFRK